MNNHTVISAGGSKFKPGTDCYWEILQNVGLEAGSQYYDYQIDVNITSMTGVLATIHNGTVLNFAGDAIELNSEAGLRNFTFNASSGEDFFADTFTINKVWIKFTADSSYEGGSSFTADVGLRAFNKTNSTDDNKAEDDDDDEDRPPIPIIIIPISKQLTFNEKVVMNVVFWAIILYCAKKKWCYNNLCFCCPCMRNYCCPCCCERVKRKKDLVENEFKHKVNSKRLDFDVNMSHSDEEET